MSIPNTPKPNEDTSNKKKRIRIHPDLLILICIGGLALVLALFFSIFSCVRSNISSNQYGKCVSISLFGKMELKDIDKAIIYENNEAFTITDTDLIDQIVSETKVATHADVCYSTQKRIELYRGDKIVRSMGWADCCNTVKVYESDLTHWLIPELGGTADAGYIVLSDDLVGKLNAVFDSNKAD